MNFYEEFEAPEPEQPEPRGVRGFFRVLGQNCDAMLMVNIVFLLTCLPVVTIPIALYALHRIVRRMILDKGGHTLSRYWEVFRKEWKQAYLAFFVSILPMIVVGYGAWFYLAQAAGNLLLFVPFVFCAVAFLTLLLGSGYLYGLLADERPLSKDTVALALRLGLAKPLRTVLAALCWYGMVGLGILWFPYSGAYLFVIGFSLPCLLWQYFIRITLKKFA